MSIAVFNNIIKQLNGFFKNNENYKNSLKLFHVSENYIRSI
ncbi:hypothetical protein Q5M85_02270 [Paraclostridium bifermentans]|nr:hypothetical protein [Paraclostridium bifermentans]